MDCENISARQRAILDYLKRTISEKGYPPSFRDICEAVNLKSTASVHKHLTELEQKGYIRRDPLKPRAIEIVKDEEPPRRTEEIADIPLLGRVAAGTPLLAAENIEEYFPLPVSYLPDREVFMLSVKGDSMIKAGILDGDRIIVARQETATNGDIVVALIEDSATVKRYYRVSGYIRLQPENDLLEPIIVRDQIRILGKVIGVLRLL